MRMRGLILAGVAGAAILTACETSETGQADGAELQPITVTGSQQDASAPPPPPPAPPPPVAAMESRAKYGMMAGAPAPVMVVPAPEFRDQYEDVDPNPVKLVSEEPVSTFSIDVDTASYANVRRFLEDGVLPPKDAVRIEELINYFDYTYPQPAEGEAPFSTQVNVMPSPFAERRELMQIGIQGRDIDRARRSISPC